MKTNLIFIHGFRGNSSGLKEVASYFDKKKFNIYTPNIPPAGDYSMREYTPLTYAKFIADYIEVFIGLLGVVFYLVYDRYLFVMRSFTHKYLSKIIK